jgi:hypothetical protein
MSTTLEQFAGKRPGNYCTLPTIDVEILNPPLRCAHCGGTVTRVQNPNPAVTWQDLVLKHEHPTSCRYEESRMGSVVQRCRYCGTDDPAHLRNVQASWSDETHCSRCGGVNGYAIGD